MTGTLRSLHTWVGLFNLTALIVFALTGMSATLPAHPPQADAARMVDYAPPADMSDKAVADDVLATLKLPLAGPIPDWAVHRNDQHLLVLEFGTPNGIDTVTVLEADRKLKIEHARNDAGAFVDVMHTTTSSVASPDLRVRLWALYVDASIFSLLFMAVTGPWLWLASRPRLCWARVSLAAGAGVFAALWFVLR